MRQIRALLWKEWREDHVYLWIGLGVLLILPLINAWQEIYYLRRFELRATDWIFLLGGIFTVVVSVGVSCRDLSEPLEDFWRSRPVAVGRWMLVKYFAGLAIVLTCCVLPAVVQLLLNKKSEAAAYIVWFPFLWTAIFSVGFLTGCLLRKSAQTSLVAISAMLLIYFLPIVLPPLRCLNVMSISVYPNQDSWGALALYAESHPWAWLWGTPQLYFAAGMLVLAAAFTTLALLAVKRGWRIAAGRKTMFGSIAAAFLLLLSTAAFQLGTNMPILQTISMPNDVFLSNTFFASDDKATFISGRTSKPDPTWEAGERPFALYQDVTADTHGLQLSAPYAMDERYDIRSAPASALRSNIRYLTDSRGMRYILRVVDTSNGTEGHFPLYDISLDKTGRVTTWQMPPKIFHNRVYIPGDVLLILDISEPQSPRIVSKTLYSRLSWLKSGGAVLNCAIPPAPGLSDAEQLTLAGLEIEDGFFAYRAEDDRLVLYRLQSLSHKDARFVRIAERGPSALDALLKNTHLDFPILKAGKIYVTRHGGSALNSSVTVYSTTGPHPLEPIGHFGAPYIAGICPLSDGRCIVAGGTKEYQPGNKLWLIGPPPHHNAN